MKAYAGDLVISMATIVEGDQTKKCRETQAHEGLNSELFDEIKLLLGNKGYAVSSLGVTLKEVDKNEGEIKKIKNQTEHAQKNIGWLYDKVNIRTFEL